MLGIFLCLYRVNKLHYKMCLTITYRNVYFRRLDSHFQHQD